MSTTQGNKEKVTIYCGGMFGLKAMEARLIEYGRKPYAQYRDAPYVVFIPKGKRKPRIVRGDYKPFIVMVEGWGHPEAPSAFKPTAGGSISRHTMFSPEYDNEADVFLDEYLAKDGVNVLADYRHTKGEYPENKFASKG